MQQRRLRLGDILDDYCPRERRITNHAVVAMIEEQVKQTRCTTCDADHEYKQAKVPVRRKKDGALLTESGDDAVRPRKAPATVPDEFDDNDVTEPAEASPAVVMAAAVAPVVADAPRRGGTSAAAGAAPQVASHAAPQPALPEQGADAVDADAERDGGAEADVDGNRLPPGANDDGPVHRRLIRATLPRPEGTPPEWKTHEFTVRQPGSGGGRGRETDGNNNSSQRPAGRHRRPLRAGQGAPQGPGQPRFGGGGGGGGGRQGTPRNGFGSGGGQPGQGSRPPGGGNRPGQPGARGPRPAGSGSGGQGGRKRGR